MRASEGVATSLTDNRPLTGCNVTRPNASTLPGHTPVTTRHGTGALWARFGVDKVIVVSPKEMKHDRRIVLDGWTWLLIDPAGEFSIEGRGTSSVDGDSPAS